LLNITKKDITFVQNYFFKKGKKTQGWEVTSYKLHRYRYFFVIMIW